MVLRIKEIKATGLIRIGVDIPRAEFMDVDLILWNWGGAFRLLPKPVIENMKDYIRTYPTIEADKSQFFSPEFTWDQARGISSAVVDILLGL